MPCVSSTDFHTNNLVDVGLNWTVTVIIKLRLPKLLMTPTPYYAASAPSWTRTTTADGRKSSALNSRPVEQVAQLSPGEPRDALYHLKCCSIVAWVTQTDRLLAWEALSETATYYYSPEEKHSFGRIMEILYGAKTAFTRSSITTPPKVNDLDETWSTVSTFFCGRFWALAVR